jgi:hypothetical protein
VGEQVEVDRRQRHQNSLGRKENHRTGLQIRYGGGARPIRIPYGRLRAVLPATMPESGQGRREWWVGPLVALRTVLALRPARARQTQAVCGVADAANGRRASS